MAQYVYSMNRVSKTVPPKRQILKDISLSFFPGAKIGVLGLNGSGKSTLLKIMAGVDKEIEGEAIPMPGIKIGYLPQEPQLNSEHTVRESVEEAMGEVFAAKAKLEEVYAAYAEADADFDALAAEQARLEAIIATAGTDSEHQLEIAADALRLPPWDAKVGLLSGGEKRRIAGVAPVGATDLSEGAHRSRPCEERATELWLFGQWKLGAPRRRAFQDDGARGHDARAV